MRRGSSGSVHDALTASASLAFLTSLLDAVGETVGNRLDGLLSVGVV